MKTRKAKARKRKLETTGPLQAKLAPAASDPTEILADWIEIEALRSGENQTSLEALVRVIRQTGSVDGLETQSGDIGSEISQRVAQDAFSEIENRSIACGLGGYPFDIVPGFIRLKKEWEKTTYIFLLMLSTTTPTSGHAGTASLFERLCCHAAHEYLGGKRNNAAVIRFGSPRRSPVAKLHQAIDDLSLKVAEGGGCRRPAQASHTGDDGLDIVAWRHFPDEKIGKLVAFGQCASGASDWAGKLAELDGRKFVQKWFRDMFVVDPVRLYFVPRRIPRDEWEIAGIDGGILFDRCRIVACLHELDTNLANECAETTLRLLAKVRS